MADPRYYMACIDLTGRSVLVVGGGSIALEKVEGLLHSGAQVTVVAPQIVPDLAGLDVTLVRRGYRSEDLDGHFLVIAATSTTSVNRRVFRDAEARRQLCNVVDVPELCSFILPAVHRQGPIAVAVSTGGASPRSRSASATRSQPWSGRSTPTLRTGCGSCGPGRNPTSPPMTSARNTSQGS